ncbi:RNA polymerase II-associated protein 1 isoform X2 [Prorops nasuta]
MVNEDSSVLIQGSWASEIHRSNIDKLSQMSKEDILQEKKKLEATLNPELKEFLRKKKIAKIVKLDNSEAEKMDIKNINIKNKIKEEKMEDDIDIIDTIIPSELVKEASKKGWLHMDNVESEKLKWMEDVKYDEKKELNANEPYNARFDFNGLLLPYKDESLTIDKGLHHHGEEPDRPGYSLQELLQLSRSSTQQQRIAAFNILANIIEKSHRGWYDKALHPAPLSALSERNILLLLRFSLDDTSIAVVTAVLQTLKSFLCCKEDEICLDRLYGLNNYAEPFLFPLLTDVKDTSDLKDHELAQLDAVGAILRTDIVLRLRYILSEMRPSPVGVTAALEILTRLARHSQSSALSLASTTYLLEIIVSNFIPLSTDQLAMQEQIDNAYGIPMIPAVRFCRVLVTYAGKPAAEKLVNLKIGQKIFSYITSDVGIHNIILNIEALRLWKLLLTHQLILDSIAGAHLILAAQLQFLLSNHNICESSELKSEYAAALIAVVKCEPAHYLNISILLTKWSTQLFFVTSPTWSNTKLIAESLLAVDDITSFKTEWLKTPSICSTLCSTSNLLSDCLLATEREPTCLPNLGVVTQNGELQPLVSKKSCILFLDTVAKILYEHSLISDIQNLFDQSELGRYLLKLEKYQWSLENSWYTRTELSFLTNIVKMASIMGGKLETSKQHLIWKISIKLISALPADQSIKVREVLEIALSDENLQFEAVTNKLSNLKLSSLTSMIDMNLLYNVKSVYQKYISYSGNWNQAAMPKDWFYLPLVHIYTNCKNNGSCNKQSKDSIIVVLSLELILLDLLEKLSPSLRFSRLVLVYLCETIYLDKDVSTLLTEAFSNLLQQNYKRLDFTTKLPGLNSFTDLFTAMCEQFCSSSYGDDGFSNILLVVLAQRHDVHYRKLLWSEHAGALRYMRVSVENLLIPIQEYLYPEEEDISLIECYLTNLIRGIARKEWCPVPYLIAFHHSAMYLKRNTNIVKCMRRKIEEINDKNLANALLNYKPDFLYKI